MFYETGFIVTSNSKVYTLSDVLVNTDVLLDNRFGENQVQYIDLRIQFIFTIQYYHEI